MRSVTVFNMVSIDGFIADAKGDMSWAHKHDAEYDAWVKENASGDGVLLFGRKTYEMMASFWPTPMAAEQMPDVAKHMNSVKKIVFSRSIERPTWNNTEVVKGDLGAALAKMKKEGGPKMTLMGSANIVSQLAVAGVVDSWMFVVNPIVLGKGLSMFGGVEKPIGLRLVKTRAFQNGNVLLAYEAA